MYTQPDQSEIDDFFNESRITKFANASDKLPPFIPIQAQHIYGLLRLNNELEQPQDSRRAIQLLEVYDLYCKSAEKAALNTGAQLIEMQGNLIHVVLPSAQANHRDVIAFCKAFDEGVNRRVRPKAGNNFRAFSMASYHGPAVIVRDEAFGVISEVSLGIAANRPAKKLLGTPSVPNGHVAIPTHQVSGAAGRSSWTEFDLTNESSNTLGENIHYFEKVASAFDSELPPAPSFDFEARSFDRGTNFASSAPLQTYGFCLKSDMDGFSKKVEVAWSEGSVEKLVFEFHSIMKAADAFTAGFNKPIIRIPWAGDCSTLIFPSETISEYNQARSVTPVRAASEWNDSVSLSEDYRSSVKWAHAAAGCDVGNSSNGNVIVARLDGQRREFPIAVGPGVKLARDGEQADGLNGGEMAIHRHDDLKRLDDVHRSKFHDFTNKSGQTNSNFKKASSADLKVSVAEEAKRAVGAIAAVGIGTTTSASIQIPKPKVYGQSSRS
ncbi:MAG: hypothetical protein P1U86_22420 [Verrucomicrobiales bacterium]|nr:hypothetical protein [Verrucomicrobiales bacterium]